MENPEENIFGKEHHEARAKRFIDDARKAAKEYKDLEIAVTNITEEELDMGPETELAAYLEGNEELAQLIKKESQEIEIESAEKTIVSIDIAGDDQYRIGCFRNF